MTIYIVFVRGRLNIVEAFFSQCDADRFAKAFGEKAKIQNFKWK